MPPEEEITVVKRDLACQAQNSNVAVFALLDHELGVGHGFLGGLYFFNAAVQFIATVSPGVGNSGPNWPLADVSLVRTRCIVRNR